MDILPIQIQIINNTQPNIVINPPRKDKLNMSEQHDKTQKKNHQPHDRYRDIRNTFWNIRSDFSTLSGQ